MNLLILGGTTEASDLCRALCDDARVRATISLAGRTRFPRDQKLPTRVGGFGGVQGLTDYLRNHRVLALIDATHPFATRMTANAIIAAQDSETRLLVLRRPAWRPSTGDRWTDVGSMEEAAAALGAAPQRVLLTIGRKDLAPFQRMPWHHYVIRSVDAPPTDAMPPVADIITARGPFAESDEHRLLAARRINVIVTKNSGGDATAGKLAAARALGIPVIMVRRPPEPSAHTVVTVAQALTWLESIHATPRGE